MMKEKKVEDCSGKLCTGYPQIYPHIIEKAINMCYNFYTKRKKRKDCERRDNMWYSATEIAKYIISQCLSLGKPVSNLKLQKMMYFLWVDFYKQTGRRLFLDNICAWQLGPVVPEVYYEYCSYAGRPIQRAYTTNIGGEDGQIINRILADYVNVPANVLVDRTHENGSAWDCVYQNGAGNRNIIPFELIIKKEVG